MAFYPFRWTLKDHVELSRKNKGRNAAQAESAQRSYDGKEKTEYQKLRGAGREERGVVLDKALQ